MSSVSLNGLVALVTGGGGSLGRAYSLEFARRGAKVVVNDLLPKGVEPSQSPSQKVVDEIKAMGGQAIANHDSVEFGAKIVDFALKSFGGLHILINNAGILRDVSFAKMTDDQWDIIQAIHVRAVYSLTRAAWNHMRDQKFGRIIMTTSSSGLYGNFGQANYSTAKLAQVGFGFTLAKEGQKQNVLCNMIAPIAGSQMTATVMPPELIAALKPEYVAPLVTYLVSPECKVNGEIFEVGGGWISRVRWSRSKGMLLPLNKPMTPESIRSNWEKLEDFSKDLEFPLQNNSFDYVMPNLETAKLPFEGEQKSSSAPKAASSTAASSNSELKSAALFTSLGAAVSGDPGKDLASKIKAQYQFDVTGAGGAKATFVIDLKSATPSVYSGEPKQKSTVVLTLSDEDFVALAQKKANAQQLFMKGKLKMKGDMQVAMKLQEVLKAIPSSKL